MSDRIAVMDNGAGGAAGDAGGDLREPAHRLRGEVHRRVELPGRPAARRSGRRLGSWSRACGECSRGAGASRRAARAGQSGSRYDPSGMDVWRPDEVPPGRTRSAATMRGRDLSGRDHARAGAGAGRRHGHGRASGTKGSSSSRCPGSGATGGRGLAARGLPDPGGRLMASPGSGSWAGCTPSPQARAWAAARAGDALAAGVLPGPHPDHARLQRDAARDLRRGGSRLHTGALSSVLRPAVPRHSPAHLRVVGRPAR